MATNEGSFANLKCTSLLQASSFRRIGPLVHDSSSSRKDCAVAHHQGKGVDAWGEVHFSGQFISSTSNGTRAGGSVDRRRSAPTPTRRGRRSTGGRSPITLCHHVRFSCQSGRGYNHIQQQPRASHSGTAADDGSCTQSPTAVGSKSSSSVESPPRFERASEKRARLKALFGEAEADEGLQSPSPSSRVPAGSAGSGLILASSPSRRSLPPGVAARAASKPRIIVDL